MYGHSRVDNGHGCHADVMQLDDITNWTISNSKFDWNGQQIFFNNNGPSQHSSNITVYGNLQYGGLTSGKCVNTGSASVSNLLYYNNSCVDMYNPGTNVSGTYINNIWYNTGNIAAGTHSYGYYKSGMSHPTDAHAQTGGSPFTNYAGKDFRLSGATNAGQNLGSPYNIDLLGDTRGSDGTWDRGAYEFVSDNMMPTDTPRPPSGLKIIE
jgi:hypothetical protein